MPDLTSTFNHSALSTADPLRSTPLPTVLSRSRSLPTGASFRLDAFPTAPADAPTSFSASHPRRLRQYNGEPYFGALVGRFANRIAGGQFTLDGTTTRLPLNNGPELPPRRPHGFDKHIWAAEDPRARRRRRPLAGPAPTARRAIPGTLAVDVTYR